MFVASITGIYSHCFPHVGAVVGCGLKSRGCRKLRRERTRRAFVPRTSRVYMYYSYVATGRETKNMRKKKLLESSWKLLKGGGKKKKKKKKHRASNNDQPKRVYSRFDGMLSHLSVDGGRWMPPTVDFRL